MEQINIKKLIIGMHKVNKTTKYYAFTFTANESGVIHVDTQTYWAGWANNEFTQEIRVPSLVDPERTINNWKILSQPYVVVNNEHQYFIYNLIGGNALINEKVLQKYDNNLLNPYPSVRSGKLGFVSIKIVSNEAFNYDPTPKLRMGILRRDQYKCRICDRKPIESSDIELHVHHIRPFKKGGLTEDINLITLCHTCHKGLDPEDEYSIYSILDENYSDEVKAKEFMNGVLNYRRIMWKTFVELQK